MQEMAKLRQQLSQLLIEYSLDADAQVSKSVEIGGRSGLTKEFLLESEKAWQSLESKTLNINQEMVLQQAICAGWADRVAHRLSAPERALLPEENGNIEKQSGIRHVQWSYRIKGTKSKERKEAAVELEQSIHVVKAAVAMLSEPGLTLPKQAEKMKVKVSTQHNLNCRDTKSH